MSKRPVLNRIRDQLLEIHDEASLQVVTEDPTPTASQQEEEECTPFSPCATISLLVTLVLF